MKRDGVAMARKHSLGDEPSTYMLSKHMSFQRSRLCFERSAG